QCCVEYKGVIYAMDPVGRVYANDAATGNKLWYFEPNNANYPQSQAQKAGITALVTVAAVRGLTIGDGMVFAPEPQGTLFALDAKTGRSLWHFNIIPHKGQPGHETWTNPNGTPGLFWNGGGASWAPIAVDTALDILYVSTGNTIPYTGYQRGPGKEYYTAGTLALHASTGKLAWFFQDVHHNNWDADTTLGPVLYDVDFGGKLRHAVASVNRTGILFLVDRATGKPIYPIKETPVPVYAPVFSYPTQPF